MSNECHGALAGEGDGFASVRALGARRLYSVEAQGRRDVDAWLERFRRF